jgi:hypothetical protein
MKSLFYQGGPQFMSALTILLVLTTAWIIYHFVVAYSLKQANKETHLRKLGYGKTIGLFALVTGLMGQMVGLYSMFDAIEQAALNGEEIIPALVFGGIRVTMIVTFYGILIYLFSLLLWFVASVMIEKKFKQQ